MEKRFYLSIYSEHHYTSLLIEFIIKLCILNGFSQEESNEIGVAVDEICSNIVNYAFKDRERGNYNIELIFTPTYVKIEINDNGIPFDPTKVEIPKLSSSVEEREEGKLGLKIVKSFMDEIRYRYEENKGNFLTLIKYKRINNNVEKKVDITEKVDN